MFIRFIGWIGDSIAAGPVISPIITRGGRVLVRGVLVTIDLVTPPGGAADQPFVEVRAKVRTTDAPRLLRHHAWADRARPRGADAMESLRAIDAHSHGDDRAIAALPYIAATWDHACTLVPHMVLVADGTDVIAWLDGPETTTQVDAVVEAVAAVAAVPAPAAGITPYR